MVALDSCMLAAIDAAGESPARAIDSEAQQQVVILKSEDFDWVRETLGDEPDLPRCVDLRTQLSYAIVPADRYERFKAFFEEDPISPAERQALTRDAGRRAGWDGPAWDTPARAAS